MVISIGSLIPSIDIPGLSTFYEPLFLFLLVVAGLVIIILVAKVLMFVLPGAILGFVVWFLTGSLLWAGIAFIAVSLILLMKR